MTKKGQKRISAGKLRLASVDIGTNSALLLILQKERRERFSIVREESRRPRIGAGIGKGFKISQDRIRALVNTIKVFLKICEGSGANAVFAVGTEALRRAKNSSEVLSAVERETALPINILSGAGEASLSYLSATAEIPKVLRNSPLVIDVGAGSTEMIYAEPDGRIRSRSIGIGALKLKEQFKMRHPLNRSTIEKARSFVAGKLRGKISKCDNSDTIAVGGTATAIPSLEKRATRYENKKLDFHRTSRERIDFWIRELSLKNSAQLCSIKGMPVGREDIIVPGLLILSEALAASGSRSLLVRNRGLRFGVLFSLLAEH